MEIFPLANQVISRQKAVSLHRNFSISALLKNKTMWIVALFFCMFFTGDALFAQEASPPPMSGDQRPAMLVQVVVLVGLSLLPFAIILLTSFLKMVIVLSLLRNALGVQQSPPNQAINGIALIMAIYVMFPTGMKMYEASKAFIQKESPKIQLLSPEAAPFILGVVDRSKEPLRQFLIRNCVAKHQRYFYQLAYRSFPEEYRKDLTMNDFLIVIPAYITSQVKTAFEIGVLIYLPFFVIDLVVSNILLAMGMMMLSPLTIALPLKLLLIVMVDGWTLVIQGITQTFR